MSGSRKSAGASGRAACTARIEALEHRKLLSVSVSGVFAPRSLTPGFDAGAAVTTDSAGNVYVTGIYTGGITLGKGLNTLSLQGAAAPGLNGFVAKYNSAGDIQWATSFTDAGLKGQNQIGGIALDPQQSSVYITGQTSYKLQIGPNAVQSVYQGAFAVKLAASDGGVMWTHEMLNQTLNSRGNLVNNPNAAFARAVAVDTTGNVFVGGYFSGTVLFNVFNANVPGSKNVPLTANAGSDAFLLELHADGTYAAVQQFAAANVVNAAAVDSIRALAVDKLGNLYVTGSFQGSMNFSGKTIAAGAYATDIFVAKLNHSMAVVGTPQKFGGAGANVGRTLALDPSGNVWVGGNFQGTANFGGGNVASKGGEDAFLLEENSSLKYLHYKTFGSTGNDQINSIAINAAGVYSTGFFSGPATLDKLPAIQSKGGDDIFVAHLSTKTFLFDSALGLGGTGTDTGNSIALGTLGHSYLAGYFNSTVIFNPALGSSTADSGGDFFLLQLLG